MSPSSIGRHAGGATSSQPAVPEPSFAERARTLMHSGRIGSLSTLSRKQPGFPFGSLMPYGLDDEGRPLFLVSTMAMHTQNLQADPRASLFVSESDTSADPLGSSRVTLIGNVTRVPQADLAGARTVYLAGYPDSKYWVDFEDFSFYRMDVLDVYYVGGFGVMGWVAASDYAQAKADPLVEHKSEIIQHMNADHKDALILLAKQYAGVEAQDVADFCRSPWLSPAAADVGWHEGYARPVLARGEGPDSGQRGLHRDGAAGASSIGQPSSAASQRAPQIAANSMVAVRKIFHVDMDGRLLRFCGAARQPAIARQAGYGRLATNRPSD